MPASRQPEVLPPLAEAPPAGYAHSRLHSGDRLFTNENLDLLAHILDDAFRIPGTQIRFGLDGIIGLLPGLGDVLAGLASCILIFAAWVRGVPYIGLARMVVNLGLDVIIGAIPFFGDVFDIAWKANRRNYALLIRHIEQPRRHTWKDWVFLGILAFTLTAIFLAPLVVLVWIVDWFAFHR